MTRKSRGPVRPKRPIGVVCVTSFALMLFADTGRVAHALPPSGPLPATGVNDSATLFPAVRRYEFAGFPILGGNSDIGIQFGGAATVTRFFDTAHPYLWNVDLLLSGSVKNEEDGFRFVQQSHVLRVDAPQLFGGRVRLDARLTFQRTINAGYYGIGNATVALPGPGETSVGSRYQYLQQEGWLRAIVRVHTRSAVDLAFAGNLRYEGPQVYAGSKLAEDLAARHPDGTPALFGGSPALLASLTAGLVVDTRDSEFITRRGVSYQLGLAATNGSAEGVSYGEASAVVIHYAPLGGPFIFASRLFASFRFGRLPFYDLQLGGAFEPEPLLGSDGGVRGVPQGRYAGLVKVVTNTEIRSTPFPRFRLAAQSFLVGTTTFFDAGRVWSRYAWIGPQDGTSLGLKYGVGGGIFLQWGEAAIIRIEVAYSPDAVSENPGFPVGIYVSDGLTF
jgi:Omp85 superfamily domain